MAATTVGVAVGAAPDGNSGKPGVAPLISTQVSRPAQQQPVGAPPKAGGDGDSSADVYIAAIGVLEGTPTLNESATVSGPEPGYTYTVYADVSTDNAVASYVEFKVAGKSARSAVDSNGRAVWTSPNVFVAGQQPRISATPFGTPDAHPTVSIHGYPAFLTVTVNLDSPVPSLSVQSPTDSSTFSSLNGTAIEVPIKAFTADVTKFGARSVQITPDVPIPGTKPGLILISNTEWDGSVPMTEMPLGTRSFQLQCSCGAEAGIAITNTLTVHLNNVDRVAPQVQVLPPPAYGEGVPVDPMKRTVQFKGTATDSQSGMKGGKAGVWVSLSKSGSQMPTDPQDPGDWSAWSVTVTLPDPPPGDYKLYVWATDATTDAGQPNGNTTSSPVEWPFQAINAYVPASLDDRLSESEYLTALMVFARDQLHAGSGSAVSSDALAKALGQPFDQFALPLNPAMSTQINELRVPIEILRHYMADQKIQPSASGQTNYLAAAYQALLSTAGTSSTELRRARVANQATRAALATRLGITLSGLAGNSTGRPDQLDALTLDATTLSENALEKLFGLSDTTADPARTVQQPRLLAWQIASQRLRWRSLDLAPPIQQSYSVIVDPDVINEDDVADPLSPVIGMITSRRAVLKSMFDQLDPIAHSNAIVHFITTGSNDRLATLLQTAQLANVGLLALRDQEQLGVDISPQLSSAGLTRPGFLYLVQLRELPDLSTVTDSEWSTVVDILVGSYRRRQYSNWLKDETTIALGPDTFKSGGSGPVSSRDRIDPSARLDWESTLRGRTSERQALLDSAAALVSTAEQLSLPVLRDALLRDIAGVDGDVGELSNQLTTRYQLDFSATGSLRTTRLREATGSLQSLFLLVRSGDNHTVAALQDWTPGDLAAFDAAWSWMGSIAGWQSALTAFLFPEAALDPMLLPQSRFYSMSQPFKDLVTRLAVTGPVDPNVGAITEYLQKTTLSLRNLKVLGKDDQLAYLSNRDTSHQVRLSTWCDATSNSLSSSAGRGLAMEVFWAVPMLIARRMHANRQFQDALDWFWVAFPYNSSDAPPAFDWLRMELGTKTPVSPDLTVRPDWTSNLDPFTVIWTGQNPEPYRPWTWLRSTLLAIIACLLDFADAEFTTESDESLAHARDLYLAARGLLRRFSSDAAPVLLPVQPSNPGEGKYPLPQLEIFSSRADTQLKKIRQGRNIAGLQRQQSISTGTSISQPTPYHYKVLNARAVQLAQQAITVEAEYLAALEKYDQQNLRISDALNAGNIADLQLAAHDKQIQEATDAVAAATAQQKKASVMSDTYAQAIAASPNQYESNLLNNYKDMRAAQDIIVGTDAAISISQAAASGLNLGNIITTFGASAVAAGYQIAGYAVRAGAQIWLNNVQSQMQANQLQASIEDRRQQWGIEQTAAEQDGLIAQAQVTVANDHVETVKAEQAVAQKQRDQAQATLTLLANQFTNADLYQWMSETLGGVYRYFLQQATATARLAQAQLAFERAEPAKAFIQSDYFRAVPSTGSTTTVTTGNGTTKVTTSNQPTDRRGMTGAERLMQDLTELDQYAFSTDVRRLNLSQTFSLVQLLPVEFLGLKRTGQINFVTPMEWFDQDFPGHYQRLIRQVHVSVVALIPPSRGIRASLSSPGISRVIAPGPTGLAEIVLRRDPTTIGLTSPVNANGVFQIDLQAEMLLPFEGSGVQTAWQFSLPPAANPFDFSTLSDVLFTIDYTALFGPDYQTTVIRRLNADLGRSSDRMFSLAQDFPDQWYQLVNPDPGATSRTCTVTLRSVDFPPNMGALSTSEIAVQLSSRETLDPVQITLARAGVNRTASTDSSGIASSRRGAAGWRDLTGTNASPVGDWKLTFGDGAGPLFSSGALDDVLFVLSWSGRAPAWPG